MRQAISKELRADAQNEFLPDAEYCRAVSACLRELYPSVFAPIKRKLCALFFRAASETLTEPTIKILEDPNTGKELKSNAVRGILASCEFDKKFTRLQVVCRSFL